MADFRTRESAAAGQATTVSYVDLPLIYQSSGASQPIVENQSFTPLGFHVWNTGANAIDFKVLGSNDSTLADSLWVDQALTGFTNVGAAAAVTAVIAQPGLAFYKIQVQDHVGASHGTANAAVAKMASE